MATQADRRQQDTEKIWKRYAETGDRALRDRLVLTFVPLVRHLAYRKVRELPAWCEVDDLVSSGVEGLIGALDRYDPAKGASLEQFVWTRIQGAVLDSLRRLDWAPRSLRRFERDAERAGDAFFRDHGRRPNDSELAAKMGVEETELVSRRRDLATAELTSLDSVTSSDDDDGIALVQTIADDDNRADPEAEATRTIARERFRRAFSHLSERERRVAVMLYTQGRTLSEIGEVIGVSESRVCQIHGELKKRLRSSLRRDAELFSATA
ncbi:MAG TPA: FliA/WhiG family RNA polymerase sigma factor [Solirubrobacterales bacterium]|jgi:RNA polymerase sigma factor for flagellar operon FliA|nr:FliA/WhiG family RNA polymerase sigma factor [Solirubrobacterales bacterium]